MNDEHFSKPYIDLDEWREDPVPHRFVHGGFAGTDTRFSAYFPSAEQYEGRFFQHITPVPDSEHLAQSARGEQDKIGFSIASGGYFLETNGGGLIAGPGSDADPTIGAYRANAAAATYSRVVAAEMYGDHRPYGYVYGGSGGGYRTIGCAENTTGVWDGFVPYVIGSSMAIPNMFTVRMHAQRMLRDALDRIVDAVEPGGSGDIYEGLDAEQRDALLEVTRMGFSPRSWIGHRTMGMHAFPILFGGMMLADPSYVDDFWSQPGYLGFAPPQSLTRDLVQHSCEVVAMVTADADKNAGRQPGQARGGVDTAWQGADVVPSVPVAVRLSSAPGVDVLGAELHVESGDATGACLNLLTVVGDVATFGPGNADAMARLAPGDAVVVDNRRYLATQTYHRHQVPTPDFHVWDQFRHADGSPIYPQRPLLLGPLFAAGAAGTVQTGRIEGKMIVVACLLDREALPWQADWYRAKVRDHFGSAVDDHLRLWYVDNAFHGDDERQENPTHAISYVGVLHQALRDVSRWVEQGIAPAASTSYEVVDGQVVVPPSGRRGVQPVVRLAANGNARADVRAGDDIELRAAVEVPAGTGEIVSVEWDVDGAGDFPQRDVVTPAASTVFTRRHSFAVPGTYFPTVRVAAHRDGDANTAFARIHNLARVRVVVT